MHRQSRCFCDKGYKNVFLLFLAMVRTEIALKHVKSTLFYYFLGIFISNS
ncbi:hypothetical protein PMAG_a2181 [Pseudoalteromonas mariniglutinosa NCIMB 1770]|nr:hypothetical protein [Pseudoalteromonas mariniglutinosa NCIMB 1770]